MVVRVTIVSVSSTSTALLDTRVVRIHQDVTRRFLMVHVRMKGLHVRIKLIHALGALTPFFFSFESNSFN